MLKDLLTSVYHSSEAEARPSVKPDYKVMLICVIVAFCLTMIKYFGDPAFFLSALKSIKMNALAAYFDRLFYNDADAAFWRLLHWVSCVILFYLLPPFLLIRFVFREKWSDYGLSFSGAFRDVRIYLMMLAVMIPLVLYFSRTESFQERYPFYDLKPGESFYPNLVLWELFYFIQFFALEFFFRGFMLHGTRHRFGFYSIFVMTIPYCMIHFGKPLPETIAAIIAGVVLGILSLKSRSIWLGVAIHYSVAITMDVCALWQKGLL